MSLLPPADEVWGKVIFSQASVILLMGGWGSARETPHQGDPLPGRPPSRETQLPKRSPARETPHQGDPPPRRPPARETPPGDPLQRNPTLRRPPLGRTLPPGRPPPRRPPARETPIQAHTGGGEIERDQVQAHSQGGN